MSELPKISFKLVHKDKRGCLFVLEYEKEGQPYEMLLLTTDTGFARGGDLHDDAQYNLVLDGMIIWVMVKDGNPVGRVCKTNDVIMTPPNTSHFMVSLTPSTVLEWHTAPKGSPRRKDKKYRELVDRLNSGMGNE